MSLSTEQQDGGSIGDRFPLNIRRDERGSAMMEYSLMAALIAVIAIGGVSYLGEESKATFNKAGEAFTAGAINPDDDEFDHDENPFN